MNGNIRQLQAVAKLRDTLRTAIVEGVTPSVYLDFLDHLDTAVTLIENIEVLRVVRDAARAFRDLLKGLDATLALRSISSAFESVVRHACVPFASSRREQLERIMSLPALAKSVILATGDRNEFELRICRVRQMVVDDDFTWIIDRISDSLGMDTELAIQQLEQCSDILGWYQNNYSRTFAIRELQTASVEYQLEAMRWVVTAMERLRRFKSEIGSLLPTAKLSIWTDRCNADLDAAMLHAKTSVRDSELKAILTLLAFLAKQDSIELAQLARVVRQLDDFQPSIKFRTSVEGIREFGRYLENPGGTVVDSVTHDASANNTTFQNDNSGARDPEFTKAVNDTWDELKCGKSHGKDDCIRVAKALKAKSIVNKKGKNDWKSVERCRKAYLTRQARQENKRVD